MKLLMLQGLPASGKSTYAETLCKEQNWKRVNRDLIRTLLHFDIWSGRNESTTVHIEEGAAERLLASGYNVVVDDCNLNPKNKEMWKGVAERSGAKFSTKKFDTAYEACILRDALREKKVGHHVIRGMALQYALEGTPKKNIVICDIDGTVADTDHRTHFVQQDPKDWKGFFEAMVDDPVREDIRELLRQLHADGKTIVFVSGRPENYREFTEKWLMMNGFDFAWGLLMRGAKDSRPDTEVKKEIFDRYFAGKEVVKVIDDRPSVIRMWREQGLEVLDVGKGIEF